MMMVRLWGICLTALLFSGCAGTPSENSSLLGEQTSLTAGLAALDKGDLDGAHNYLRDALNAAPQDYRTQLAMARYSQQVGDNAATAQYIQTALHLAPDNAQVLNNYGAFLCRLGQYVPAQQQFSAAAKVTDNRWVADSLEYGGYCFLQAGQSQDASALLIRALKVDPDKSEALLNKADEYLKADKPSEAQTLLKIHQKVMPASARSLWLQIRFAALANHRYDVARFGKQLTRNFPQSKQCQQFLANEY